MNPFDTAKVLSDTIAYTNLESDVMAGTNFTRESLTATKALSKALTSANPIRDALKNMNLAQESLVVKEALKAFTATNSICDALTGMNLPCESFMTTKALSEALTSANPICDALKNMNLAHESLAVTEALKAFTATNSICDALTDMNLPRESLTATKAFSEAITSVNPICDALKNMNFAHNPMVGINLSGELSLFQTIRELNARREELSNFANTYRNIQLSQQFTKNVLNAAKHLSHISKAIDQIPKVFIQHTDVQNYDDDQLTQILREVNEIFDNINSQNINIAPYKKVSAKEFIKVLKNQKSENYEQILKDTFGPTDSQYVQLDRLAENGPSPLTIGTIEFFQFVFCLITVWSSLVTLGFVPTPKDLVHEMSTYYLQQILDHRLTENVDADVIKSPTQKKQDNNQCEKGDHFELNINVNISIEIGDINITNKNVFLESSNSIAPSDNRKNRSHKNKPVKKNN